MSAFLILFSRPSFVTVLACAAVVSFIIRPHAAKAYPTIAPVESGAQPILRSYKRYSLLPSELGIISGTETAQRWKDPDRDGPSVIYHQPNLLFRKGHLSYTPDEGLYQEGMTHRGQGLGGVKSASSISTSHSDQHSSSVNHNPFLHKQSQNGGPSGFVAPHNGNSQSGYHYNWHPPIIRKSSQQERPLPQSASQVDAQKPYDYDKSPRSGTSTLSESRSEDKSFWQSPDYSPSSFRTSGYWSSQTKGHNSDNKESNAGAGLRTSGIQSSKFPFFFSQSAAIAPSVSSSLDSSFVNPEKLTSSITHFSQGVFPPKSNEKTGYKRVQSYLLRDSHTSNTHKGVNTHNFPHSVYRGQDFNQQTRAKPNLFSANTVLIRNANGTRFDGQLGDVMKYQPASIIFSVPKKDAQTPHNLEEVQANSAYREVEDTRRGNPSETGQTKESFNPSKAPTDWPVLKKNNQPSIIFNKDANSESTSYRFMRPTMLQKYSFGQRIASGTSTQEKPSRQFSSDRLDATPTTPNSMPFHEVPLMLHLTDATNSNSGSIYRVYKRPHGQEGYVSHPLSADSFNQVENDRDKSGGLSNLLSTQEQNKPKTDLKTLARSAENIKLVTLTRVKPTLLGFKMATPQSIRNEHETTFSPFSGQLAQGKGTKNVRNVTIVRRPNLKAVTYDDIIGSASFSSVMPASTARSRGLFDNSRKPTMQSEVVPQTETVNSTDVMGEIVNASRNHENATEMNSVSGNKFNFRKGEAETQLEISDLTVKEKDSEAKSVPHGLPSDSEENLSESLLELDYLRTSTGNVSFQSINLNL